MSSAVAFVTFQALISGDPVEINALDPSLSDLQAVPATKLPKGVLEGTFIRFDTGRVIAVRGSLSQVNAALVGGNVNPSLTDLWIGITPSLGNIRALVGDTTSRPTVLASGFWYAGDPGAGSFVWDSNPDLDNGGTRVNPYISALQPGGLGSVQPGWERVYTPSLQISVAWFGAVGDGDDHSVDVSYDTAFIQRAFQAAHLLAPAKPSVLPGTGFTSRPVVYFPYGFYRTTAMVTLVEYLTIEADRGTVLWAMTNDFAILQLGGAYNNVLGLTFANGESAIALYGFSPYYNAHVGNPGNTNSTVLIEQCSFRYQKGPSIKQTIDNDPSTQRGSTALVNVADCDFETPCVFYGSFDQCSFRDCRIYFDRSGAIMPVDASIADLGCFNSTGILTLDDLLMVPGSTGVTNKQSCWWKGTGLLRSKNTRFGGESTMTGLRCSEHVSYLGHELTVEANATPQIWLEDVALESCSGLNWLEVYDTFPGIIVMSRLTLNPTVHDAVTGTIGAWIDAAVDVIGLAATRRRKACIIQLDENFAYFAPKFRQGADPADPYSNDVTKWLRPFFEPATPLAASVIEAAIPQPNLWVDGIDLHACTTRSSTNMMWGAAETETGYSLFPAVATGTPASILVELTNPATGWNPVSEQTDEFVFSAWVKANFSGAFTLSIFDAVGNAEIERCEVPFIASRRYQRVSFPFAKSAAAIRLLCNVARFGPDGVDATGAAVAAQFVIGMFAIHRGVVALPYSNGLSGGVQPPMPSTTYATAVPAAGTFKVGDLVLNADVAGDPTTYGWVCTAAPLTFKKIALV